MSRALPRAIATEDAIPCQHGLPAATTRAFAQGIVPNDVNRELGNRHRTWIERLSHDWLASSTLYGAHIDPQRRGQTLVRRQEGSARSHRIRGERLSHDWLASSNLSGALADPAASSPRALDRRSGHTTANETARPGRVPAQDEPQAHRNMDRAAAHDGLRSSSLRRAPIAPQRRGSGVHDCRSGQRGFDRFDLLTSSSRRRLPRGSTEPGGTARRSSGDGGVRRRAVRRRGARPSPGRPSPPRWRVRRR